MTRFSQSSCTGVRGAWEKGRTVAKGAADVGSPEGGGVVDAVAGHGDDAAFFLPGLDDTELVLRGHAGVDGDPLDLLLQGLLRQEV